VKPNKDLPFSLKTP